MSDTSISAGYVCVRAMRHKTPSGSWVTIRIMVDASKESDGLSHVEITVDGLPMGTRMLSFDSPRRIPKTMVSRHYFL